MFLCTASHYKCESGGKQTVEVRRLVSEDEDQDASGSNSQHNGTHPELPFRTYENGCF